MTLTILRISLINLVRDRVALVLTFVLPLVFFSVFAAVFAPMDSGSARSVKTIIVVNPDASFAARLAGRLAEKPGIEATRRGPEDREAALEAVRTGQVSVTLILPDGLRPAPPGAAPPGERAELHADRSNPLAVDLVSGLLQASAADLYAATYFPSGNGDSVEPVPLKVIDALGGSGKRPSISFFAAGLGVMFLMFAVAGRSAVLLEERENGVLGRLLAARVGMTRLLLGRWLFLVILGAIQVLAMFVWAAAAFGLDLFDPRNFAGFAMVTIAIAAAAASFGLVLSAICRTRAQLNGIAVLVILILSVVGGNMFPSFLMPAGLQTVGRMTFNAWALAAYRKVFWYERPFGELLPEITALLAVTLLFFGAARWIARRWERSGGSRR